MEYQMMLGNSVKRALQALARFWWRGMNSHVQQHFRAEEEALERYRDQAHGWRAHERPVTRRIPPQ